MFDDLAGEQKTLREKLEDFFLNRPSNPRTLKAFGILFLLGISLVVGVWAVTIPLFPSSTKTTSQNDPFTTLWNGEISPGISSVSAFDFFSGPPNAPGPTGGIQCFSGCTGSQTFTQSVQKGEGIVVIIDLQLGAPTCLTLSDSLSNTYTQQLCLTSGTFAATTQMFTTISNSGGSDIFTASSGATNEVYSVSFFGYTNIAFIDGINSALVSYTLASTDTLSPTQTINGWVVGHFTIFSLTPAGTGVVSSTGTMRQSESAPYCGNSTKNGGCYSSDSSTLTSSKFTWTNNCNCHVVHSVIDLHFVGGSTVCSQNGYQCLNSSIKSGQLFLASNSTFPAIALTNSSLSLATGVSKALAFSFENLPTLAGTTYGWFLRQNGTLPRSSGWSPLNDNSVGLAVIITVTSGKLSYTVYMQHQSGQQLAYPSCNQASTVFICSQNSTTSLTIISPLVLNYTGASAGTSGSGQSYLCTDFGGGSTSCSVGGASNTQVNYINTKEQINFTEPWLNIQNNYYVGLWLKSNSADTVTFLTSTSNVGNVISVFVPPSSTLNPNIAETGFIGWLGSALGSTFNAVGNVLGPIINPITGLGNSIISALISGLIQLVSYFVQSLRVVLNAIGNSLSLGNLGDELFSFFTGVFNWLSNITINAFGQIVNLVNLLVQFLNWLASIFGGPIWTGIIGIATLLASGWSTIITGYNFLTQLSTNGLLGINYYFLVDWIFGMFMLSTKGIEGFKTWIDLNELVFSKIALAMYFFIRESFVIALHIKQMIVNWV
jgi:hypothetical protein